MQPNADANFTISIGVRDSPGFPPMVPRMPEMLLINATRKKFWVAKIRFYRFAEQDLNGSNLEAGTTFVKKAG